MVLLCTTIKPLPTGIQLEVLSIITTKLLVEAYYDFLSNKNIHVGVSAMYRDSLRKCVATFTSNYTLYMYYLRVGEVRKV